MYQGDGSSGSGVPGVYQGDGSSGSRKFCLLLLTLGRSLLYNAF